MYSLKPIHHLLRHRLGLSADALQDMASRSWQIAPPERRRVEPVIILAGQVDRITRTEFASLEMVKRSLQGDPAEQIGPTTAHLIRDAQIIDGVLYAGRGALHLRARKSWPKPVQLPSIDHAALYETWVGNRWFGNWLLDDCLSYRLAEAAGQPITTMPERSGHVPAYERLLGMTPQRITNLHIRELILFDDPYNNSHRLARAQDMRKRLMQGITPDDNFGVFLLRRTSGDARILDNEADLARRLQENYGFRVIFAEDHSVEDLMRICGAARVIAGVEGSQLNHGIAVMPAGGTLFTLQPADRATTAMKLLSDRFQQSFAMLVSKDPASRFSIAWDEVAQTMDRIIAQKEASHVV